MKKHHSEKRKQCNAAKPHTDNAEQESKFKFWFNG